MSKYILTVHDDVTDDQSVVDTAYDCRHRALMLDGGVEELRFADCSRENSDGLPVGFFMPRLNVGYSTRASNPHHSKLKINFIPRFPVDFLLDIEPPPNPFVILKKPFCSGHLAGNGR